MRKTPEENMSQSPFEKRMQQLASTPQLPIDLQPINPAPPPKTAPGSSSGQEGSMTEREAMRRVTALAQRLTKDRTPSKEEPPETEAEGIQGEALRRSQVRQLFKPRPVQTPGSAPSPSSTAPTTPSSPSDKSRK